MNKTKTVFHIIDCERNFWNGRAWTSLQREARVFTEEGAHDLIRRRFYSRYGRVMVVSILKKV